MSFLDGMKKKADGISLFKKGEKKDKPNAIEIGEVDEKERPGDLGMTAIQALRDGDGEAFEEAIRNICS